MLGKVISTYDPGPPFKFKLVAHDFPQNTKCSSSPTKNGKSRRDEDEDDRRNVDNIEDGGQPLSMKRGTR